MSETAQNNKADTKTSSAKAKVEKEPRHLQTFIAIEAEQAGPAPDELLANPPGSAATTNTSILSREPSAIAQRTAATATTTAPLVHPVPVPAVANKNFASISTRPAGHAAIQTKLTVGAAHDPYEEEADQVAEQVMRMPDFSFATDGIGAPDGAGTPNDDGRSIHRAFEEEEEIQSKPLAATITPLVQRAPSTIAEAEVPRASEEDEELQTKRTSAADSFVMGDDFEGRVAATRGGGSPLPDNVRSFMEPRFGADFSSVRLHADSEAADLNRQVSAQAFTLGRDIYLGAGKTDVTSASGKQLLAHELTHVVQQGAASTIQRALNPLAQFQQEQEEERQHQAAAQATALTDNAAEKLDALQPPADLAHPLAAIQSPAGNGKQPAGRPQPIEPAAPEQLPARDGQAPLPAAPPVTRSRNGNGTGPQATPPTAPMAESQVAPTEDGKHTVTTDVTPTAATDQPAAQAGEKEPAPRNENESQEAPAAERDQAEQKDQQDEPAADLQEKVATPEGQESMAELGDMITDMDKVQEEEAGETETDMADLATQGDTLAQDNGQIESEVTQAQEELNTAQEELAQFEQSEAKFAPVPPEAASVSPEGLLKALGVNTQPIEDKQRREAEESDALIAQFIAECAAQAGSLAAMAGSIPTRIEPTVQQAKTTIETALTQATETVSTAIETARTQAQTDADTARSEIATKYNDTVAAITTATDTARTSIDTDYTTKLNDLLTLETTKTAEIDQIIADGETATAQAAADSAKAAKNTGAQYVAKYQAESYPEPSFLEGSDYYERKRQAKISAAQQVSEQYAAEFASKGQEVSGQLSASSGDVKSELKAKLDSARQAIESEKTAALAELDQALQNALTQAADTQTAQLQAVDESLAATLDSLDQLETSLLDQITQTGEQQTQAADQAAQQAQASLQQAVQESVAGLNTSIAELEAQVRSIPSPKPQQVEQFLTQARGQFAGLYQQSAASLETQIATAEQSVAQTGQQGAQTLTDIGAQAAPQAAEITANFKTSVDGLKQTAIDAFTQLETDHIAAVETRTQQALDNFAAAYTQAQTDADNITKCLKAGVDQFVADFKGSLQPTLQELPQKIESEANAAADKVQPAWKKVVAFIAVIVITVIVAVAIAALVASGVGLGLGLLLAAGIGALGGVAKGMINNWAEGEPITKDLLKNAVLGALDGMLQFVGGRFVAGLKLPDTGWKQVLIKKTVDAVSGVVNDMAGLAWDGKLTWETAGKTLLNNLVKGLITFGTGTALDKWHLPDGSFQKYLAESGMGTLGDTASKMTNTFLIEGEPFDFNKAFSLLGESAAENFLTNALQGGADKLKLEDRMKNQFDGWFTTKPSPIIDPKTGQPFGQKPEKATLLDADGNPIKPNSPIDKLMEAYENLGKWGRGETPPKPVILGPEGVPVNAKGEPAPVKPEKPEVALVDEHNRPLIDTDGKPVKPTPGVILDKDGNPTSGTKLKTEEPAGSLIGLDGKPLFGPKPAESTTPSLLGADGQPLNAPKGPVPKIMTPETYRNIEQYKSLVPNFDFQTPPGKPPAFWSGGEDIAGAAARKAGFATMEDTAGGQSVQSFTAGIKDKSDWSDQKPIWSQASAAYAHTVGRQYGGTNEPVYIFINDAKFKPDSVYLTVEKPILMAYGVKIVEVHGPPFNVP
jgi:hypothetical protein